MNIKVVDARRREAVTSGYGLMSHQFGERLVGLGHTVTWFDEDPTSEADIWLWMRPPHYIKEPYFDPTKPNVFFTMHEQETFTGWKKDWPALLNKLKAVVTPTEWNKGVFEKNGVTVPIYVVPLGVDEKMFCGYKNRKFSLISSFDGLGNSKSRDNWKEMIKAYYKTFYNNFNQDVSYSIKSWRVNWPDYEAFLTSLIAENGYDLALLPPIMVYEIDLVPEDYNLLYAKHHAFVKYSAGEGWSLPTLEALSTGLRILSYPTPAMLTFLNENNTDFFTTPEELGEKMWELWRRYRKERVDVGKWSWSEAVKKLDNALEQIHLQK